MDKAFKIRQVYEMLFPYGFYNENPGQTCLIIDRELRKLCNNRTRHVLLILGRYFDHVFTPETPTAEICQKIQNSVRDICLSLDKHNTATYILGTMTNSTDVMERTSIFSGTDRLICRQLREKAYSDKYIFGPEILDGIIEVFDIPSDFSDSIYRWRDAEVDAAREIKTENRDLRTEHFAALRSFRQRRTEAKEAGIKFKEKRPVKRVISDEEIPVRAARIRANIAEPYLTLLTNGDYNGLIRFIHTTHPEIFEHNLEGVLSEEEIQMFLNVFNKVFAGEILLATGDPLSPRFTQWDDIC